jgi:hypothetical protein
VAPTLVPVKAGDRVKTDRRDAQKLARSYRAGDLTAVWVPDAAHEALRDLMRTRGAAKKDQLRARHRLSKLLLRRGLRPAVRTEAWSSTYMRWVKGLRFEQSALEAAYLDLLHEVEHAAERIERLERSIDEALVQAPESMRVVIAALQALRGVGRTGAVTLVAEVGYAFRQAEAAHGLQRHRLERAFERRADATGCDHQGRKCSLALDRDRSELVLPTPTLAGAHLAQAPAGAPRSRKGDRLEGAVPPASSLLPAPGPGIAEAKGGHGGGERAARLRVGDRGRGGANHGNRGNAAAGSLKPIDKAEIVSIEHNEDPGTQRAAIERHTERRILVGFYATGLWPNPRP